jgi:hypothetical protein
LPGATAHDARQHLRVVAPSASVHSQPLGTGDALGQRAERRRVTSSPAAQVRRREAEGFSPADGNATSRAR